MGIARRISGVALGLTGATTALPALAADAGATTDSPQIQANIQGNDDGHNGLSIYVAQAKGEVQWLIQNDKHPNVISINELCKSQLLEFGGMLDTYAQGEYQKYWAVTKTTGLASGCQGEFGNVVYARGNYFAQRPSNGQGYTYSGQGGLSEKRKLACLQVGLTSPKYWACTTHLKNHTNTAKNQLLEGLNVTFSWNLWPKDPVIAGDFNLVPSDVESVVRSDGKHLYNYSRESDRCGGIEDSPTTSSYKFDYIFGDQHEWQCDGQGFRYNWALSDHQMIGGNLVL